MSVEKRYYYTDPLAAAYMAKHYRMQLKCLDCHAPDGTEPQDMPLWEIQEQLSTLLEYDGNFTFYIHPDSYHILEPQVGDLVDGWASRIGYVEEIGDEEFSIDVNGGSWECPYEYKGNKMIYTIIQRDGKPFFWPESE